MTEHAESRVRVQPCDEIAEKLAAAGDLEALTDRRARKHIDSCLRCQAEAAQYRRLLKALHALREDLVAAPHGLVTDIFVRLETAGERQAVRSLLNGRKAAYVGGIAVATAAAGAGAAVLLVNRSRRKLTAA
jgi:anti-sigma factor RsiW